MLEGFLDKYRSMHVAAKAAFWFMICSFLQKAMSVITTPIFSRIMTTEQYGQFTVFVSWVNLLAVITTLRLDYSVFNKGMSKFKEGRDEYVSTMQTITTCLCSCLFFIYLLFRPYINRITGLPTYIMFAMMAELLVSPAISFWTLRRRYDYEYRDVVARTLAMTVLNALFGVLAVVHAVEKGYARILSVVAVSLCFGVPIYLYNLKRGHYRFVSDYARYALLFNLPLLAHFLSMYALDQSDRIMIQQMVGFTAAGLYGLTYNVGTLIKIFTTSLNSAIVPWMYRRLEYNDFEAIDKVIFISTSIVCAVGVGISVVAPEAIALFADERYREAIYVVPPVALGMIFQFLYTMYANVEFFFDMNKVTMLISGAAALINVLLNILLIPRLGYVVAGYTTLLCYLLMCVGHFMYMMWGVSKKVGSRPGFRTTPIMFLTGASLVMGVFATLLYEHFIVRYAIVFCTCVFIWIKRDVVYGLLNTVRDNR